jgi:tetratricopeptide (TPR) repeat protein
MRWIAGLVLAGLLPAQNGRPVEELRSTARERVAEFRAEFERILPEALRELSSLDPRIESPIADKARARLGRYLPAFPEKFLEILGGSPRPSLRPHLYRILQAFGTAELAGPLLRLSLAPGFAHAGELLPVVAALGGPEFQPELIAAARASPPPQAPVLAAIVEAAAASRGAAAAALGRSMLEHAEPVVRAAAATAVGLAAGGSREDAQVLIRCAQSDPDPRVRCQAVRAMRWFPRLPEAQRLAHDMLKVDDPEFQAAALDALEAIGTRDVSPNHFLEFVQGRGPDLLRERAARHMALSFGDTRGARILAKAHRENADRSPKDVDAQMEAGDTLKSLGAYEEAMAFYKRAIALYNAANQWKARVQLARCNARLGRFEEARRLLRTDYKDRDLHKFADDPDFAEMKADARYKAMFEAPRE